VDRAERSLAAVTPWLRGLLLAATPLAAGCRATGVVTAPDAEVQPASSPATLEGALQAWIAQPGRVGVSAAVIRPDGSLWTGARGLARAGEPLRPDHQIAVGSITKTVTAALVLQLSEAGRLALDDTVAEWLGALEDVPPQITLRQLLNHTCGIGNYTLDPAFAPALAADPARRFTPQEVLALFLLPPRFAPGARTEYTNTSFLLLGLVAEAASGRRVADLWRERFWGPLGVDEVFLPPDEAARGSVADAWVGSSAATLRQTDPLQNVAGFSSRWAAFGRMASPRAVARWGRALFGGDVLEPSTRGQMLQFVPPEATTGVESGSGLGVRRYAYGGREQWGHSGASAEGSAILLYEPASGVTLAVAMNQSPATHASSHFALAGDLLRLAGDR
jgi:D-alanyl-D-alanine carboxypeptidase